MVIGELLPRSFYARPPEVVAQDLIGRVLLTPVDEAGAEPIAVRVTETEAYHGQADPASHAYRGPTARTAVIFGPPGFVYVYFVYGMHWCVNVVTGDDGDAAAVLLRGGAVIGNLSAARSRRRSPGGKVPRDIDLARGPARLGSLLRLSRADSGADLFGPRAPFAIYTGDGVPHRVVAGPRVGVGAAGEVPWRFFDGDAREVSQYRAGTRHQRKSASG